jgi:hypothetical protein
MRGLDKTPMEAWVPHRDAIFYAAKPHENGQSGLNQQS